MKINKWFGLIISAVLIGSVMMPTESFAKNNRTLQDESIYDLLVDRFNNGNYNNDVNIDVRNPNAFSGGDFAGITDRRDYIADMGFTLVSIGSIFSTSKYDGSMVLDYEELEPHFGTEEEFIQMIEALDEKKMGVIADFPLNGVSEDHVWAKDGLPSIPVGDGAINWNATDESVQEKLKDAVVAFVEKYGVNGIRLTKLGDFDDAFLNEVIQAVKAVNEDLYVFSTETSSADFDSTPNFSKIDALKQGYVQVNPDTPSLDLFNDEVETDFIQFDELTGPRFTYDIFELRMFPPTRWKLAATALFTFPGVPVMLYGTEIAVNGKEAPESHPISNFKTDMELQEYISDLNFLRNESETLRNGDFELLHNEDGFTVFTRTSDEETWVIALNNTSETQNLEIAEELIGENKRLRGVLDQDMVRQSKDGMYRVVLERELAEIYIVNEDKGFNTPYLIASILVYVLFLGFLFAIWRRGKRLQKEK